jgi:hypothetical protein
LTTTGVFTYDLSKTVNLISTDTATSSPYSKRNINLIGSNFGTNIKDIQVFLERQDKPDQRYELKVITITDTTLQVRLAGGRAGKYNLVVSRIGWGRSRPANPTADDVELGVKIYRINNNVVSLGGGSIITIEGLNFDDDIANTLVSVGEIPNWFCDIVDVTES